MGVCPSPAFCNPGNSSWSPWGVTRLGPTALWSGEVGVQAILPLAYQQGIPVSGAECSTVRLCFTFFHFLLIKYLHKGDYSVPFDCGASCADSTCIRGWWRGKEGQQSSVIASPVPAFLVSKWKRSSHPCFCSEVPPPLSALNNVNASQTQPLLLFFLFFGTCSCVHSSKQPSLVVSKDPTRALLSDGQVSLIRLNGLTWVICICSKITTQLVKCFVWQMDGQWNYLKTYSWFRKWICSSY